jgi:uncharacterized protein (DUF2141 family)
MTKIIIAIVFFITSLVAAQNVNLTVKISGLKSNTGLVQVGLFNSEGTFLKKAYKGVSSDIKSNGATVTFLNIPKGKYAISAYHDKNSNSKLDTNFIGIPKEDFACSNNAKGTMGPPKYEDAKFDLSKDSKLEITFNN